MQPPFLGGLSGDPPYRSSFEHSYKLAKGSAEVIYIPAQDELKSVLIFIPGNPGLLPLYIPFLTVLSKSSPYLAVIAHSHLGQAKHLPKPPKPARSLDAQIDSHVELVDAVRAWGGEDVSVTLAGHSVGAWLICEVIKRRMDAVDALFLLTPTLSNIASTPNGRRLRLLFTSVAVWLLPVLCPLLIPFVPLLRSRIHSMYDISSASSEPDIYTILRDFVTSPTVLGSCLYLARCEMQQILTLEDKFFELHKQKIYVLWAGKDDWVGEQRAGVERALGVEQGGSPDRVVEGENGIPHSFSLEHGPQVGRICTRWLQEGALLVKRSDRPVHSDQARTGPIVVKVDDAPGKPLEDSVM